MVSRALPPFDAAPQHGRKPHKAPRREPGYGPRPLPLFLDMLREQTEGAPQRRAAALSGLRAFQNAPRRPAGASAPVRFCKGAARLLDHGPRGSAATGGPAIVFIPSLINPPHILDHGDRSLLRWLAGEGHRPFLLDWGTHGPDGRHFDLDAHVTDVLLPLIARFDVPPVLVGYCLGGTLALAAACLAEVAGLALIAAPWRFAGFGDEARAGIAGLWTSAKPACETLGLVPMEVLQAGFWRLDPARTVAKYEVFAALAADGDAARRFVALEDWANAGAPLPYAAGRQMFEDFLGADMPGAGAWRIAGKTIAPEAIGCPAIDFVSLNDRIVPAASAAGLPDRRDLAAGHVGMVVGRMAEREVWEPLSVWLKALR